MHIFLQKADGALQEVPGKVTAQADKVQYSAQGGFLQGAAFQGQNRDSRFSPVLHSLPEGIFPNLLQRFSCQGIQTVQVMDIMDSLRQQWGVVYPQEQ